MCSLYASTTSQGSFLNDKFFFLIFQSISRRNYQRALDLMRRATAMPSTKTDYYDEVSGLYWLIQYHFLPDTMNTLGIMMFGSSSENRHQLAATAFGKVNVTFKPPAALDCNQRLTLQALI